MALKQNRRVLQILSRLTFETLYLEKQLREVKEEEEAAERRMQESTSGLVLLQSDLNRAELRLEDGRGC